MLRHVILWKLKEGLADVASVKAGIKEGLEGLVGKVPGLLRVRVQTEGLAGSTADVMLDAYLAADPEQRVEKYPFPREALRELILNALVHKDYASNIPVQISVSDDKIYVANVGSLPENWTLRRLLGKHPSKPYNPTIAGCVYLTGKIETWDAESARCSRNAQSTAECS